MTIVRNLRMRQQLSRNGIPWNEEARFSGHGYATEMARTSIAQARSQSGFGEVIANVDEINAASLHVLEKLGFERISPQQGSFGNLFLLRLAV